MPPPRGGIFCLEAAAVRRGIDGPVAEKFLPRALKTAGGNA